MRDILNRRLKAGDLVLRLSDNNGCYYYGMVKGNDELISGMFRAVKDKFMLEVNSFRVTPVSDFVTVYKLESLNAVEVDIVKQLSYNYNKYIIDKLGKYHKGKELAKRVDVGDLVAVEAEWRQDYYLYLGKGKLTIVQISKGLGYETVETGHCYLNLTDSYFRFQEKCNNILPVDITSLLTNLNGSGGIQSFYVLLPNRLAVVQQCLGKVHISSNIIVCTYNLAMTTCKWRFERE